MPRQRRYFLPNIPQYVVVRGVDKQATFFAPDDYLLFEEVLTEEAAKADCPIHAYVLMTNHVHLLLTPRTPRSIPRLMQGLGRHYVQAINRRYRRTGTLWQGRYKACLVQADRYFLACQQYIELNPVRAGMVKDPAHYRHSSYRCNALGAASTVLTPHEVYLSLADNRHARLQAYRKLFESTLATKLIDNIRESTHSCQVLGSHQFTEQIEGMLKRRVRPANRGRPKKVGPRKAV